jgi:hypothetical protein
MVFNRMNTYFEPTDSQLMTFTHGKWYTIETVEERERVYADCVRDLERRRLERQWDRLCPPLYRNTIPEQLPNPEKFEEVQKWKYGPTGLLLLGPTRCGKTRAVWTRLRRLHLLLRKPSALLFHPREMILSAETA